MTKLALCALTLAIAANTAGASTPFIPAVQPPLFALAPVAIVEGGTVMSVPKSKRTRGGRILTLPKRAEKPAKATKHATVARNVPKAAKAAPPAPARSCACSAGGSSSEMMDLRGAESGLRVLVMGPDGLTRTRYVPAPPAQARQNQEE